MTATMRAVVLDAPGPPEALRIRELPVPQPRPGWVLIQVKAFGINRSELHMRLGLAKGVTFPRVLGIEATGVVAAAPGGEFEEGLVQRANAEADARGVIVALTDAGVARLTETAPVHLRGVSEMFVSRLDDEELAVLENALDKVTVDCTFG